MPEKVSRHRGEREKFMKTRRILAGAVASSMAMILAAALSAGPVAANHVTGGGSSFLFLQPGFTQDIFGVSQHFMGGVAFAPDGDPWVDDCQGSGSHLHRYDAQSTPAPVNGTSLHTESIHSSNAGCGLTGHSNGSLYSNLNSGVVRLNASTGAQTGGPFGPAGNALGIAEDPETGNLIYVGLNGTLYSVNPALTTSATFSTATTGNFVDGLAFDPTGDFLFAANRSPFRLTILDGDTGALIQQVPMASEPDGISFHATTPKFVVTNNTNGTMTRFDFPGDNYALVPAQSLFASGGFRGDLSQVGSDGCIYLTQDGTRYNNLVVSGENSLVRICGGFAPPTRQPATLTLDPKTAENPVNTQHCVTATVKDQFGDPFPGVIVRFSVTGSVMTSGSATTDANGQAKFCYQGPTSPGADKIHAYADTDGDMTQDANEPSDDATKTWVPGQPATLTLNPKTAANPVDSQHCVIATVKDALGNPVPGITVRFSVTGSVNTSGSATTDANGEAKFCYNGPPLPGADTIRAYADTNKNGVQDPGEPGDVATKTWVLPVTTPGCEIKITNGGWFIADNRDQASFGGNAKADEDSNVTGNEEYQDHGPADPFNLHGNVLVIVCGTDGKSATIFGEATIDGAGSHIYRIDVIDNGEPGKNDHYRMRVDTYDSGDHTLKGGNIQVHKS
jgi:hypothetical protein